jgi:hypothetical protein
MEVVDSNERELNRTGGGNVDFRMGLGGRTALDGYVVLNGFMTLFYSVFLHFEIP